MIHIKATVLMTLVILVFCIIAWIVLAVRNPYFKNCTEAYAKGVSNIRSEHKAYRAQLDRDGDKVACELGAGG